MPRQAKSSLIWPGMPNREEILHVTAWPVMLALLQYKFVIRRHLHTPVRSVRPL